MPSFLLNVFGTMQYAFAIITLLGGVIAVHELGHFLFAKWAGIRVDTFSIGFGPKLFSRKWGETEYCLSLIPLGGFVKIYGQDPDELVTDPNPAPDRAFSNKSLGQKVSVLFGGPLFNYILAILIFALLAVVGIEKLPAYATRIVAESPAYTAGLRSGDTIQAVDGQATRSFEDVHEQISKHPEKSLKFSLLREGRPLELDIKVQKEKSLTPYGEESMAGVLEGLDPYAREPFVATTRKIHPWGFMSGDRIKEFEGAPVHSWEDLEKYLSASLKSSAEKLRFKLVRNNETIEITSPSITPLLAKIGSRRDVHDFLEVAGIHNPELFVQEVVKDSPAEAAGLKQGDRMISVNGQRVYSFDNLRGVIQHVGDAAGKTAKITGKEPALEKALKLEIEREDGKKQTIVSAIQARKGKDPLGEEIISYTIGIMSAGKPKLPPNMLMDRTLNPFRALWIGTQETTSHTVMTVVGLKKLLFGEVSAKSVGGPIMIGKLAGDTFASRGWRDFLRIMAIISISLGVFNLIPVPILDGGHIVFAVVESMRGRPLSHKVQQTALKVGLSLILLLMVFALYNDISRVLPLPF